MQKSKRKSGTLSFFVVLLCLAQGKTAPRKFLECTEFASASCLLHVCFILIGRLGLLVAKNDKNVFQLTFPLPLVKKCGLLLFKKIVRRHFRTR